MAKQTFGQNQGPAGREIVHIDPADAATRAYVAEGLPLVFPEGLPSPQARALTTQALAGIGRPENQAWTPDGATLGAVRAAFEAGGHQGVGAAVRAATEHGASSPSIPAAEVTRPRINRGSVREVGG